MTQPGASSSPTATTPDDPAHRLDCHRDGMDRRHRRTHLCGICRRRSIADAFNDMVRLDGTFYWVGHDSAINDYADGGVLQQLAATVQSSGRYQLDLNSYGPDPLVTAEAMSFDARIGGLAQNRVNRNWNGKAGESIGMGIAAVMSSVNFGGTDTLVNPHGRPLKGFTPGRLTGAQADELERKRVNYFATIGPQSIYTPAPPAHPASGGIASTSLTGCRRKCSSVCTISSSTIPRAFRRPTSACRACCR